MDAGVFAVDAANRSLLHSLDFIKDETPATLCIHRLLPPLPSELRVQAEKSCRPAIYSTTELENYFQKAQRIILVVPRQNHFVRRLSTFITNTLVSHKSTIPLYNITSYQSKMQH